MNKTLIIAVVGVVIIGSVVAVFLIKSGSSRNSPLVQNRNVPAGSISTTPVNPGDVLPARVSPPKNTTSPAGMDQTAAKKRATDLIKQMNASAGEFNTMNNSASQMDQNTSL